MTIRVCVCMLKHNCFRGNCKLKCYCKTEKRKKYMHSYQDKTKNHGQICALKYHFVHMYLCIFE